MGDRLQFFTPGLGDVVDIVIVWFILYRVLLILQRTRALQIAIGMGLLAAAYGVARISDLILTRTLIEATFQYGAIAALIVFQPELRAALARLGRSRLIRAFQSLEGSQVADELVEALERLSRARHGAIIAIEQKVGLGEYAETGSPVEARVSAEMLTTIFTPYSPLHDGAVLLAGDQIRTAGAILPLTQSTVKDRSLGTRHRAALGLSEETDAIVLVVSEETSQISMAIGGRLERDVTLDRVRALIEGAHPAQDLSLSSQAPVMGQAVTS